MDANIQVVRHAQPNQLTLHSIRVFAIPNAVKPQNVPVWFVVTKLGEDHCFGRFLLQC